jgi:hypothetical protein
VLILNAIYAALWLLAFFIWGDLKEWKKYYPTLLFFIMCDILYLYLLSDFYPMWSYNPQGIDEDIVLTNTHVNLSIMLVKYPATTFIYLSKFPKGGKGKKVLFYLAWVFIYIMNEAVDIKLNLIEYDNGWNFYWSILFNFFIFFILRVHYLKPLVAWVLSFIFIVFLWNVFDIPKEVFR